MTREIPLTRGYVAIVDAADYEIVAPYKWHAAGRERVYACARPRHAGDSISMHRLITGAKNGEQVDHCDGNGLNNRRANLRKCNNRDNARNQRRPRNNTSGFKGVTLLKRERSGGPFRAYIHIAGRQLCLGHFRVAEDAARAYDRAAIEHFGQFACLNFPEISL